MDFGDVIRKLKKEPKSRFTRKNWSVHGNTVSLQVPDEFSKMGEPYLYQWALHRFVPWMPSQVDMLADDWYEYSEYNGVEICPDSKGNAPRWCVWWDNNADVDLFSLETTDDELDEESSYFRTDSDDKMEAVKSWNERAKLREKVREYDERIQRESDASD